MEVRYEMERDQDRLRSDIGHQQDILDREISYKQERERAHQQNLAAKNSEIAAHRDKQKAIESNIFYQNQVIASKEQSLIIQRQANEKLEGLLNQQREMIERQDARNQELAEQIKKAQEQNDVKLQKALETQMAAMNKVHKEDMDRLVKVILDAESTVKNIREMTDIKYAEGFGKIAGYESEKKILIDSICPQVATEKAGEKPIVPSGILFYGPMGNGKTTFAEALAGQLKCPIVTIAHDESVSPTDTYQKIVAAARDAQKRFEKEGIRTIISVDELDIITHKDYPETQRIAGMLKSFMDKSSEKYHCTIFTTTNYPDRIDRALLRDGRFMKVGLPPANKANAKAVLMHYAEPFADGKIDYDALAEHIVKVQPNAAYSNARIESIVTSLTTAGRKIKHSDLYQSIVRNAPDISREDLELFAKNMEYLKPIAKI